MGQIFRCVSPKNGPGDPFCGAAPSFRVAQRCDAASVSITAVLLEGVPQALRELDLDQFEQALPQNLEISHQVLRQF